MFPLGESCHGSVGFEWKPEADLPQAFCPRSGLAPEHCHCMSLGGGWTELLYAFFKGGGFKQFFQTELIGSSPVICLLRRSPLIVIWLQFFIHRTRKRTMCISPQEPNSCLRRRWPLLSRKLSAVHLVNDVCHATVNQSCYSHAKRSTTSDCLNVNFR